MSNHDIIDVETLRPDAAARADSASAAAIWVVIDRICAAASFCSAPSEASVARAVATCASASATLA